MRLFKPDADLIPAAIRLARLNAEVSYNVHYEYDWAKGEKRPATWAEKRAVVVSLYDAAKSEVRAAKTRREQLARAEAKFGTELAALRLERRMLDNKPFTVNIAPMIDAVELRIAGLIASA